MGNREAVLKFLRANRQKRFTNSEIVSRTSIRPHPQVFQITQFLRETGQIEGIKDGKEWKFWSRSIQDPKEQPLSNTREESQMELRENDSQADVKITFHWARSDFVRLENEKILFPKLRPVPGVYRFTIKALSEQVYVGETDNLQRRMCHYRTPGPSQFTNMRLNKIIRDTLKTGGAVLLSVITSKAHLVARTTNRQIDLSEKVERVLLEHAAVLDEVISGSSVLNLY